MDFLPLCVLVHFPLLTASFQKKQFHHSALKPMHNEFHVLSIIHVLSTDQLIQLMVFSCEKSLVGQRVLITGGSRGIGKAIAAICAEQVYVISAHNVCLYVLSLLLSLHFYHLDARSVSLHLYHMSCAKFSSFNMSAAKYSNYSPNYSSLKSPMPCMDKSVPFNSTILEFI